MTIIRLTALFVFLLFTITNLTKAHYKERVPAGNFILWALAGTALIWAFFMTD